MGKDELDKLVCSQHGSFMAQLVEHCSANTEAMGSNPVEALKNFFPGLNLQLLSLHVNCDYSCDDHISISNNFFCAIN